MTQNVQSVEQRVAGALGQVIVDNAKLGYELEMTRARAAELEARIGEISAQLQQQIERAERAEAQCGQLAAAIERSDQAAAA
jgi:hypothetical protein